MFYPGSDRRAAKLVLLGGDRVEDVHVGRLVRRVQRRHESGENGTDEDQRDDAGAEGEVADDIVRNGDTEHHSEERAEDDADQRTEHRHDHRLPADGAPGLSAVHADRTQQADLACPLEHAECERDRDADHGDDDREEQQDRDDEQQLVDLVLLILEELGVRLDRCLGELLEGRSNGGVTDLGVDSVGQCGESEDVAGRLGSAHVVEQVEADEPVQPEGVVGEDQVDREVA